MLLRRKADGSNERERQALAVPQAANFRRRKMKKRKMGRWVALAAFTGMVSVTGVLAYFTDREEAENVVTMGAVEIELEEPSYPGNDSEEVHHIYPGQKIPKDPQVTNTGKNPAYIRQEVWIPLGDVRVYNPEGGCMALEDTELVTYTLLDGWKEEESLREQVEWDGALYMRHIYSYNRILEPGEKTSPVFSELKVINLIEGEIPGGTLEKIPVKAHGIQSQGFDSAEEAWDAYGIQQAEEGWE